MSEPRYYVKEHTGYLGAGTGSAARVKPATEVMILDRAYCHRVVWSSLRWLDGKGSGGRGTYARLLDRFRDEAAQHCAEWNAEDAAA